MTNTDFEKIVDTSDEWIVSRTGIKERHIASDDISCADMSFEACKNALEMSGLSNNDIDLLIVGTVTPDYRLPSTACVIQEKLGIPNAVAFDIVSACTGFINGLSIADSFIRTGTYKNALVVGTEKLSSITNYNDRNTCVLFGDGAGAAVVTADTTGHGIISSLLRSDGTLQDLICIKVGGTVNPYTPDFKYDGSDKIYMNGSEVFKVAVKHMCHAAEYVVKEAGINPSDISIVIPHQANIRIIQALAKRLKVDMDKVFVNIHKYGNTSAASVPIALDEANRSGLIKEGDYVIMVAFGSGLIWGSSLVRW